MVAAGGNPLRAVALDDGGQASPKGDGKRAQNRWEEYPSDVSRDLEAGFQSKRSVAFLLGSKGEARAHQDRYRVDFRSQGLMEARGAALLSDEDTYEEVNTSTRGSRQIKRTQKVREARGPCVVCVEIGSTQTSLR